MPYKPILVYGYCDDNGYFHKTKVIQAKGNSKILELKEVPDELLEFPAVKDSQTCTS